MTPATDATRAPAPAAASALWGRDRFGSPSRFRQEVVRRGGTEESCPETLRDRRRALELRDVVALGDFTSHAGFLLRPRLEQRRMMRPNRRR
jgi:hypothetical protein